ncbi:MAG: Rid family hydrolase [Pirellulales bacterium]
MWFSRILMLMLLAAPTIGWSQGNAAGGIGLKEHRYLYVVTPGIRDYLEFGGAGILVFDIDQDHKFVKRIETTASRAERPRNIKGVCASAITNRLYFTTPESLYCVDLANEKTLWEVSPKDGCDRMSITPDGKLLYVPSFEKGTWNVIDAIDGKVIQQIETNNGAHNTVVSQDGKYMYLGGLKAPYLFVADTSKHTVVNKVGPMGGAIRPFTVDAFRNRAYICVNDLLGFEVADLNSGKLMHRVEVSGVKSGPVKRHGCPSHGVGLTPDEREVWVVDAANQQVHIFDNTKSPPQQIHSIPVREQPGWITFSIDGRFAYPSTGEVIDIQSKKIVAVLTDEVGREVHSEKMIEIHLRGNRASLVGDQFGVGRKLVDYQGRNQQAAVGEVAQAAMAIDKPIMLTEQFYSQPLKGSSESELDSLIQEALVKLNSCFLDSATQTADHARRPVLKLNFVVDDAKLAERIPLVLAKIFDDQLIPPLSIVVGTLPDNAAVGVDAVAIYDRPVSQLIDHQLEASPGRAKICPSGPRVYIAGQAEKGSTTTEAAVKTIEGLKRTLAWLGCSPKDAMQAKCFLNSMTDANLVREEFAKAFEGQFLPLVFVQWKSSVDLPIEIEMVAGAPTSKETADAPNLEFLTPPWMKSSPVYARVVRVNRGNWIYTAGLTHAATDPSEQVTQVYAQLKSICDRNRSDFTNLVKATYFVSSDDTSKSLNDLRPNYYDPSKPPSASKAMVKELPGTDIRIQVDMIGVSK